MSRFLYVEGDFVAEDSPKILLLLFFWTACHPVLLPVLPYFTSHLGVEVK
jgi:hypothetical protein